MLSDGLAATMAHVLDKDLFQEALQAQTSRHAAYVTQLVETHDAKSALQLEALAAQYAYQTPSLTGLRKGLEASCVALSATVQVM